jgi:hypothetical protein
VDSQTGRGAETVGRPSRGFDAGKEANGRKRHIATDTCGWLLAVLVTGANVQDRDAGHLLMWIMRTAFPTVRLVWAEGGYAGKLVDYATTVSACPCRSCPSWPFRSASSCCTDGGVSSGRSRGSTGAAAPSGTTSGCRPTTQPSSTGR